MEISKKQKTEILNAVRHELSVQHMDSLEYLHGEIVGEKMEEKTQHLFEVLENLPNFAIHNIIAEIRGQFRSMLRVVLAAIETGVGENGIFDNHMEAMMFLYDHMMASTKPYLRDDEEEEEEITEEKQDV